MTADGVGRRRVLESLAATAALATAGCLSLGDDSTPRYADRVPATDDGLVFAYVDVGITEETDGDDPVLLPFVRLVPDEGDERRVRLETPALLDSEDPLLTLPLGTGGSLLARAGFAFFTSGLGSLVERDQPDGVEEMLVVDGVTVGFGEFDTDRADDRLRTGDRREFGLPYEFVDETGGFRFYEMTGEEGRAPATAAVSEERILFGPDRAGIERLVETGTGERTRAVDALDGFDRLTGTVGDGDLVAGWYGPVERAELPGGQDSPRPQDVFTPDEDVVAAVTLAPEDDELTVELGVRSDDLSADRRETLEAALGTASREFSTSVEDGQFSASGTYDEVTFESAEPDEEWTDDLPSGDDLPPEITEAVPEGAIEFSRKSDQENAVRVEFVEDLQVDELLVRAINADSEISTENPELRSLTIFPDPDGDEIRVVVTVDNVSGVIATEEFP